MTVPDPGNARPTLTHTGIPLPAGLDLLRNWLKNHYLVEATEEWKFMCCHGGSLNQIPFPHSYEDQRPGNKGPFYRSNGIHPQIEPTLANTPCITNTMLEALVCHDRRQSEARDCQEYSQQQNNSSSPIVDFPSPAQTNREDTIGSDDAEGATAAAPVPKTKITVEEYQCHKALEEAHVATFLDEDEYGEMLDYEDFAPQDDPANIHISYQMPTPAPEEVPEPMASQ